MTPEMKKRMKMALKCAEDCSDEELVASVEKMCHAMAASTVTEEKLTAAVKGAVAPLEAKLQASEKQVETLTAQLGEAKKKADAQAIETLIASAKSEGRAVEPLREFIVEAFATGGEEKAKKLIASAPVVRLKATGSTGTAGDKSPEQARQALTAQALELSKSAGIPMSEARIRVATSNQELASLAAQHLNTHAVKES
jgi:phage I-like protein